jgi:hypothetical protein
MNWGLSRSFGNKNTIVALRAVSGKLSWRLHGGLELHVNPADVLRQPLIDHRHEGACLDMIEAVRGIALCKLRETGCKRGMCVPVLLGHWAVILLHTAVFEVEVVLHIEIEAFQQHAILLWGSSFIEGGLQVVRQCEDRPMLPINARNTDGILVRPLFHG